MGEGMRCLAFGQSLASAPHSATHTEASVDPLHLLSFGNVSPRYSLIIRKCRDSRIPKQASQRKRGLEALTNHAEERSRPLGCLRDVLRHEVSSAQWLQAQLPAAKVSPGFH